MGNNAKKIEYPIVQLQAIARVIGDATTTRDIELVVSREGMVLNHELGAKWRMLTDVFIKCSERSFWRILVEFLHFLNEDSEREVIKIVERNGTHIEMADDGDYFIIDNKDLHMTSDDIETYQASEEAKEKIKYDEKFVEKIRGVREHHQAYIDVVEQFCKNYKNPSKELNEAYIYLKHLLAEELKELGISPYEPFKDLYSAESEYVQTPLEINIDGRPEGINWDYFRPKLYGTHSQVVQMLSGAKATTQTEARVQEISSLISKFRDKQTEVDNARSKLSKEKVSRIEIVGGKMEIEGLGKGLEAIATKNEDTTITKNKKVIRLPHFQSTPWQNVTIRFLDERNVLIQGGTKTVTADYEALGFSDDKSKKPNLAWAFILGMAKNKGETKEIPSPIPDNIKQFKQQISDFLKKLFKNDTQPFYDFSETNTYKLKIKLTPPQTEGVEGEDHFGVKRYLEETMTSEYETPPDNDNER